MQITRGIIKKPLKVVVYGPEGIGKTTFAAAFPAPVFIDTENSSGFLPVDRLPKPTSWTMLLEEVKYAAHSLAGSYKTLVIDTADWAEALCKEHVCAKNDGVNSIEDFGYGKGYTYIVEEWGKLLNGLTEAVDAGFNVVLTAHAALRKFEQPDERGSYDRWALKLTDTPRCSSAAMTKEWADLILFANYKTIVVKEKGNDKKGKVQGGQRVMYTTHHPCWDAKNRQGLPDELPFQFYQIAHLFEQSATAPQQQQPETVSAAQTQQTGKQADGQTGKQTDGKKQSHFVPANNDAPPDSGEQDTGPATGGTAPVRSAEAAREAVPVQDTGPAPGQGTPSPPDPMGALIPPDVPPRLADLMRLNKVADDEVRGVIAGRGYFPADTPWNVMDSEGFVDGWVIPFWDKIVDTIESDPGRLPF